MFKWRKRSEMELLSQETVLGFVMALREGGNVC